MEAAQLREVTDSGQTVAYTLIRKKVKNINLSVKSNGHIYVSASPKVPEAYIDDFVCSKIPFIMRAMERIEQQKKEHTKQLLLQNGECVPYLGRSLTLVTGTADRRMAPEWILQSQKGEIQDLSRNNKGEAVFRKGNCLYIYAQQPEDGEGLCMLYEAWQKIHAGMLCMELSRRYYPVFEQLGVPFPVIKIRNMSSRWGSCIPSKYKITFNSRLLGQPVESIEYVVVHEFAHFIHPDHSKDFYQFVEQILPDWKTRRDGLKMR